MERFEKLEEKLKLYYDELDHGNFEIEEKVYEIEEEIDMLLQQYSFQDEYYYAGPKKE